MGRKEKPLDPDAGPVQRFAADLRALRVEAGSPTYRAMAQRTEYSAPALSQAAAGEKLPTLAVTLAYVAACGGDTDDWEKRWRAVTEDLAAVPREDAGAEESPYRGLTRFEPGDADVFFGRDQLIESLLDMVRSHRSVVVLGPSGSGKSSLLRAGLIPRLSEGAGLETPLAAIRILTPGAHPVRTHAERLRHGGRPGDTLVLVDQFEEVFTLCTDPAERAEFIDLLLSSQDPARRLRVVLGVRADFYGRCLDHPELVRVIREAGIPVGPLSREELREVIVRPATARGLTVERALTAQLLDEVAGEPGGLPLLSHALLETWRRRSGRMLTLRAYEAAGGVRGAVAQTAEELYDTLDTAQAALVRRVLLRLVAPGEGTSDTSRPVERAELRTAGPDSAKRIDTVLDRLARARLVTLDGDTVHLAHEALITSWPRLRGWIEEDRHRLHALRRLTEAALAWQGLNRDSGALYRGARLAEADEIFTGPDAAADLTEVERGFLAASRSHLARERRRLKGWVTSVSVLLVLALVAGVVAWQQNRTSDLRRLEAAATRAATAADTLRSSDPMLALRLAVAAWRLNPGPETRSALLGALGQNELPPFAPHRAGTVDGYALSPDGRTLTTLDGPDGITRWDLHTRRQISSHRAPPGGAFMLTASPGGRYLIVQDPEGERLRLRLWDVLAERYRGPWAAAPEGEAEEPVGLPDQPLPNFGEPESGTDAITSTMVLDAFSSSGHAWTFQAGNRLQVWSVPGGRRLFDGALLDEDTAAYDITADNRTLAVCTSKGLRLWDLRIQRTRSVDWSGRPKCAPDDSLTFSPDGRALTVSGSDGLHRWNTATGRQLAAIDGTAMDRHVLSEDGRFVASVSDGALLLWSPDRSDAPLVRHELDDHVPEQLAFDLRAGVLRYVMRGTRDTGVVRTIDISRMVRPSWHREPADEAVLSADGSTLAVLRNRGGGSGHLTLYDTRTGEPRSRTASVRVARDDEPWTIPGPALSADGRRVVFASGPSEGGSDVVSVAVWDTVRDRRLSTVQLLADNLEDFTLSPDGRELTTSDGQGPNLTVWNTGDGRRLRRVTGPRNPDESGATTYVSAVSADGRTLLHDDGTLTSTVGPSTRKTTLDAHAAAAFSPDGDTVALLDINDRITLWDVRQGTSLGILAGGVSLNGPSAVQESTGALAFSPDSSVLVAVGASGTLRMWDVPSRRPLGTGLATAGDEITSLAFSPNGSTLFAAGRHVPLQRYTVDPDRLAEAACHRAGGPLSRQQWRAYLTDVPYRRLCGQE
ncbi:PD40 domain-containing protein [Streptomyces glaucescens]|uniref:Putative WD-40 repeat protein n=1 Tax=Streptomyces glaucescens TaxID=1907 RepID=A0A089XMR3_STRGA|nr:PD40 domain-containing protein [Streptomyces glaucescens]AIS02510.1 putative WD-40 repeat protein [Streptomyces glaucescens]